MKPWERFLQKYTAFGANPTVESYVALFDPAATLLHPGMAAPIGADRVGDFIARSLQRLRDFHFYPINWAANEDTIFVEARNTAMLDDGPIEYPATYCITLRDDRVLRGRAYYDRTELLAHFESSLKGSGVNAHSRLLHDAKPRAGRASSEAVDGDAIYRGIVEPYAENWQHPQPRKFALLYTPDARMINPGFERALPPPELAGYYTDLLQRMPDLRLQLMSWAAAPGNLFIEWVARGTVAGKLMTLPVVDRFTLLGLRATEGVAYFDDLMLRGLADPAFARFADISSIRA
jgi:ketosteroid isomerase-like protein